jgi:uncharacterized protein (DUF488 family)
MAAPEVLTIGHSTRSFDELLALLREHEVTTLVDVRRFPGSRRHPQFNAPVLARALEEAGIAYVHEPDLGGHREPRADSPNTAWRLASFRGYADHMASTAFRDALERIRGRSARERPAVMCAEAVPWRCHRQLISDALVATGTPVTHILGPGAARAHEKNPSARLGADGVLVYPAAVTARLF